MVYVDFLTVTMLRRSDLSDDRDLFGLFKLGLDPYRVRDAAGDLESRTCVSIGGRQWYRLFVLICLYRDHGALRSNLIDKEAVTNEFCEPVADTPRTNDVVACQRCRDETS